MVNIFVRFYLLATCIGVLVKPLESVGLGDWLWGHSKPEVLPHPDRAPRDDIVLPEVPFESTTTDERFLQEAQDLGLASSTRLDTCQQGVVLRLRSSCSTLSEEQLAKLSVALLNCQSAAEGRPQYPCSDDMSLRACTSDMDPDTWNTYHLMSNRARAVCLAARQSQFRALTEMTVNKLMSTARGQLDAMASLQQGQDKLSKHTENALQSVAEGHRSLLSQQESLRMAQRNAHNFVAHSLRDLAREKATVAAGHRELARLAQGINQKLDVAGEDLQFQGHERKEQHQQLLADLKAINSQAAQIWTDLERSAQAMIEHQAQALKQYEDTLASLRTINASVIYLQKMLETTRFELDQRLGWISNTLGGAGVQLDLVLACLAHLGYLLVAMITTAFLGAPGCTRVLLLLLVMLNMSQIMRLGPEAALSMPATSFLLLVCTLVNQLINTLHGMLSPLSTSGALPPARSAKNPSSAVNRPVPTDHSVPLVRRVSNVTNNLWSQAMYASGMRRRRVDSPPRSIDQDVNEENSESSEDSGHEEEPVRRGSTLDTLSRVRAALVRNSRDRSPMFSHINQEHSQRSTPQRSSTPRQQCSATCLNGLLCRLPATASGVCYRHSRQSATPR